MFEDSKIPKKIESPIQEAVFEIRYDCPCPGDALYGLLFDIFKNFPNEEGHALPILQMPQQIRLIDPNLKYQPYYRAFRDGYAFAVGPHSIVFSALKPYRGWTEWKNFFYPIVDTIKEKNIIRSVERIGLRTFDLFDENIFGKINAKLTIADKIIDSCPTSFFTEFDEGSVHVLLNVGNNTVTVNGQAAKKSLIDIDCICWFNCEVNDFFIQYKDKLEKAHLVNKQVFFGLMKQELLASLKPEYN
jgi:uncharacterized protein (TIGR04255 family)